MYGLPATLTPDERLQLRLNLVRARQYQVHTAVEGAQIASGAPGSLAYYARWGDAERRRDTAVLAQYARRPRG